MAETVGMILCGGFGKRLRPLTERIPKPLIEIKDGYTILDKQLFDLKNAGIKRAYLLTGFLGEKIEERYGDNYKGLRIEYVREEKPLGTLNAIRLGMEAIDGEKQCIIRNGDVVADLNIKKMIHLGEMSDYPLTMFITRMQSPYGIVETSGDKIVNFREKPLLDYYINAGVYFSKGNLDFGDFESGDIEKTLFPLMAKENKLGYYREDGLFWMAIDTSKELEEIRKEYRNREDKPWGYEKILINTEKYLTKELFIREGYRTSFHYHEEKDETMYIISGSGYIEFDNRKEYFSKNDTIRIEPGERHSIVAMENTILHEVSTPHLNDTVRVQDYYTR
ncbi:MULTISPECIES: sugar phosphate nucleotidyltransferase [Methanothermobacter]|uniref:NTP transferase domain-containing protein n=1 Tax=Methanothermobacter thermautotrophicus TaxID=145262 RepID=A0A7J4MUU9_METTF|nr:MULTISPECIES: sugar phosphate nucleotidyltransferase [Methanothermobacter]MBC7111570.1 NTP transferase domain-containing protein [Methanothermobacter sp.]NLU03370.1 NTP transferase domain-containing protein [Methanothermobacter sp.]WBF07817.1 NTP transferase domain-containing protein [Methanothermobacter thermautotrophicus]BAM70635.1 nucleotidyltransferase [Methanothermobacter sp. CaT2]BAZ99518.1 D-glycero-alpha-D-manno-heptose 1-phosphate guanylyltransferase [Methanothermobacter sp. EMTCat